MMADQPLMAGSPAPSIRGTDLSRGPRALFFYKVTCPTCQMAAPAMQRLEEAFQGRLVGIGQDPPEKLDAFAREYGLAIHSVPDLPPYPASNAYGIRTVPTVFVVNDGTIADVVEAWDRSGLNRAAAALARLLGRDPVGISAPGDGLPPFRPG